jgi:hypothetical protein
MIGASGSQAVELQEAIGYLADLAAADVAPDAAAS